jgi:hypothetical protein
MIPVRKKDFKITEILGLRTVEKKERKKEQATYTTVFFAGILLLKFI